MKRNLDDCIIESELESRYKDKILKKYKNRENLFEPAPELNEKIL